METTDLRALSILLIDDNANMRRVITTILKSAGVRRIHEADDGLSALRIFQSKEIDIIFTDLVMQPVDGLAFVKWVRTSSASPNRYVPIIMMTGHATQRTLNDARMAGVTEFLVKPLTARTVMHRVNEIINNPRPFVRAKEYFGPCRRRRIDHDFVGVERRGDVPIDVIPKPQDALVEMDPEEVY
ncbi:response regulator [Caulobacter segnis]|uniref:response regulator n=1 Tax=Caulobacter segnis TaxID=88688 RepID=UPI00285A0DA7|nr:response regulator [Caulobacter segnis]MDR6625924.1 CheY-like chemotaxis protein [Caulobacter segnis]